MGRKKFMTAYFARKFEDEIYLKHVVHDSFDIEGWNLDVPLLAAESQREIYKTKTMLDKVVHRNSKATWRQGFRERGRAGRCHPEGHVRRSASICSSCWRVRRKNSSIFSGAAPTTILSTE